MSTRETVVVSESNPKTKPIGRIAEAISNIDQELSHTNKLLADIENIVIMPRPQECCNTGISGPSSSDSIVYLELERIAGKVSGYNQCLAELLDALRGQLGGSLKLV